MASIQAALLAAWRTGSGVQTPDWVGPIRVASIPGKGRGVVTVRQVEEGELLVVNKAFVAAPCNELLASTVSRLETCSQKANDAFFALCRGSEPNSTPLSIPDLRDVAALSLESSTLGHRQLRKVDRQDAERILDANAHELDTAALAETGLAPSKGKTRAGLFLMGSMINHSCRPTAVRAIVCDTMFVRAARSLAEGEEITDSYVSVLEPGSERRRVLRQRFGFDVDDDRSFLEENLLPHVKVDSLMRRLEENATSTEDFSRLAAEAESLCWSAVRTLCEGSGGDSCCCSPAVLAATRRLGPNLQLILLGSLLSTLVVKAASLSAEGRAEEAAAAHCRCCEVMEETARHSAYHVKWAMEALKAALQVKGKDPAPYIRYARKVVSGHFGEGVFEAMVEKTGEVFPGIQAWPPSSVSSSLHPSRSTKHDVNEFMTLDFQVGASSPSSIALEFSRAAVLLQVGNTLASSVFPFDMLPEREDSTAKLVRHDSDSESKCLRIRLRRCGEAASE
mmetsp:Transcript_70588/g.147849  ORF Transcript_70588/g.147849 Transcript_70588/m.147849 type:complete len:508 (+) Transcript_70588:88-1611(+)